MFFLSLLPPTLIFAFAVTLLHDRTASVAVVTPTCIRTSLLLAMALHCLLTLTTYCVAVDQLRVNGRRMEDHRDHTWLPLTHNDTNGLLRSMRVWNDASKLDIPAESQDAVDTRPFLLSSIAAFPVVRRGLLNMKGQM